MNPRDAWCSYLVGAESVGDPRVRAVPEPDVDTTFDADVDLVLGVSVGELIADTEGGQIRRQLAGEARNADDTIQHSGRVLRVIGTGSNRKMLIPTVRGVMEHLEAQIEEGQESEEVGPEEAARVQVLTVPTNPSFGSADDQPEAKRARTRRRRRSRVRKGSQRPTARSTPTGPTERWDQCT